MPSPTLKLFKAVTKGKTSLSSTTSGTPLPPSSSPHDEFRRVSMLLSLLAAINSYGRQVIPPTVVLPSANDPESTSTLWLEPSDELASAPPQHPLPQRQAKNLINVMTNSIGVLMTRHHEILAVTATLPESQTGDLGCIKFFALPNPQRPRIGRSAGSHWDKDPQSHYMFESNGKSSLTTVLADPWFQL